MKNIVLCCDGTANEFAVDRTNVIKLFYCLEHSLAQVAYYHPGLGTMEPPGALTSIGKRITRLLGKAFGYGLESDVRDAYIFLMNNYQDGDKIYLFGFSRGSYTARVVASMLHMYGLIPKDNDPLVPYMVRMMTAESDVRFALANQFTDTFSKPCPIHFVGVWDTVSSVGWVANPLKVPYTANNPSIEIGRQAIAIDERRAFFRQNMWSPPLTGASADHQGPKDALQVWFPGVHCDVGGGYPEEQSGLSKGALEWMLGEAIASGLLIDKARTRVVLGLTDNEHVRPDATAEMHNSLTFWWWPAEFIPRLRYDFKTKTTALRMNLFSRRRMPEGSFVHESAFKRGAIYEKRLSPNPVRVTSKQVV